MLKHQSLKLITTRETSSGPPMKNQQKARQGPLTTNNLWKKKKYNY